MSLLMIPNLEILTIQLYRSHFLLSLGFRLYYEYIAFFFLFII